MARWIVYLRFNHLLGWRKRVVVEAKTKRKAMIAAEKAYPQGVADESLTNQIGK